MLKNRMKAIKLFATGVFCIFLLYFFFSWLLHDESCEIVQNPSKHNLKPGEVTSFAKELCKFNWSELKSAFYGKDFIKLKEFINKLLPVLVHFLIKPHIVPVNQTCKAPPLSIPKYLNCTPLKTPRRVGVLLQFGFDVDALEIHLNELDEVADKFFLIESIESHSKFVKSKPLIWNGLKNEERFKKFSEKVVHFVVDDSNTVEIKEEGFARESQQERLRWVKFLEWNNKTNFFNETDLLGFGDADEIPHRDNIFYLKNCEFPGRVDIGIWFPFAGINTIFRSDFPVKKHYYTLGDPTYWTFRKALEFSQSAPNSNSTPYPSRMRGNSTNFLLGGMHLSNLAYPPFELIDYLTATEAEIGAVITAVKYYVKMKGLGGPYKGRLRPRYRFKSKDLDDFDEKRRNKEEIDKIVKAPWFLQCNLQRYPYVEGGHDLRLD